MKQRLCDAEDALHLIVTGQRARVVVDQNKERIEYNHASVSKLRVYIAELKDQIAVCEGGTPKYAHRAFRPYLKG
jgi:hypothetical protein